MAVLINGNGNEAIYAQQDADWYAALMGGVTMITAVGQQFAYELLDENTIGVKDGVIITKEGRRIQVDTNVIDTFDIPTGAQGTTNYYIIGYHLVTDETSTQTAETFVQLMENGTDTIPEGSFKEGDDDVFVSLYRVEQNDLTIGTITLLLPTISDSMQQQITQISNDLSDKGDAEQLIVEISVTTGVEIGRWIKNNIPKEKLVKGFTFNFIPTLTPGWWSGQMFCDGGSTWWGYYINRDGSEIFKYRWAGGADTVTLINQSAPYYSQVLVSSISSGYTSTVKGWLVGSIGVTNSGIGIYINGIQVATDSQGSGQASYAAVQIPISVGDTITFNVAPTYNDLKIVGLRW